MQMEVSATILSICNLPSAISNVNYGKKFHSHHHFIVCFVYWEIADARVGYMECDQW